MPEGRISDEHKRVVAERAGGCCEYCFTLLVGMTPTGRATIVKLALNRVAVVNLRRVLHAAREHPPISPG